MVRRPGNKATGGRTPHRIHAPQSTALLLCCSHERRSSTCLSH